MDIQIRRYKLQNLLEDGAGDSHVRCAELTEITPDRSIQPSEGETYLQGIEVALITCLFVRAALIISYITTLHKRNLPTLSAVRKLVCQWTFSFLFSPKHRLLSNLVWPLSIAGYMVTTAGGKWLFRENVTLLSNGRLLICKIWRALKRMQLCWEAPVRDWIQPRSEFGEELLVNQGLNNWKGWLWCVFDLEAFTQILADRVDCIICKMPQWVICISYLSNLCEIEKESDRMLCVSESIWCNSLEMGWYEPVLQALFHCHHVFQCRMSTKKQINELWY